MTPRFFRSTAELRRWLQRNHTAEKELWIGFYRKGHEPTTSTGRPTRWVTYAEALDQALCFGWIDGIRKKVDETSYTNRFTPRKNGSIWSRVNVAHVKRLRDEGLMHASGLAAFEARTAARTGVYSFEAGSTTLTPEFLGQLERDVSAAGFFFKQPPWYRRTATHWVMSAKRPETRQRRFSQLVMASREAQWIPPLKGSEKQRRR